MRRVVDAHNDVDQLIPAIDYIFSTYGVTPEYVLADKGYFKIDVIEYALQKGIIPLIPDRSESMSQNGTKRNDLFSKTHMDFDVENNCYICFISVNISSISRQER